jgi:hypothetical protein
MMPEMMNLGLMPSNVYGQAGQTLEGYQQKQIDADIARWDYGQNAPWQMASNLNAIYSGATPYASSSSTTRTPSYSNPWATAGAFGLGAYGMFS